MTLLEQREIINLIEKYDKTSRRVIKENLFHIRDSKDLTKKDISKGLNLEIEKVNGWFNRANSCIPTIYDALRLADKYSFNVEELMNTEYFGYYGKIKYPIELKADMA